MNPKALPFVRLAATLGCMLAAAAWAVPQEVQVNSEKADYDEKKKLTRLIGSVKITTTNMTLTSPYAEFHTDEKVADFQGGVKCVGPGSTATGKRMKVFYNDQRVIMFDDVHLVSEKGAGAQPGSPTIMDCNKLDYYWERGVGNATGSVKVRQGNRRAFGDRAVYHKNEQIVVLDGNVRIERGSNDWMSCDHATMNLANDTVVAEGGVVGSTKTDEKKKPSEKETPAPGPSQARPTVLEPPFPMKTVEADPQILLPGLDDRPAPGKP